MELQDIHILVRDRLDEYIALGKAGSEINLVDLSNSIDDLLAELYSLGVVVYDRGVPVESVQVGVNDFGVVVVRFNGR